MSFDIAIVVIFLIITLIVGLGHGSKVRTIKEYALGGSNFSTAALVATITATWIGGSTFFILLSKTYSDGLFYLLASTGMAASFLMLALVFVPKMEEFLGNTSVAEAMGDLYGKNMRIITAIAGSIGSVGAIAVQFKVFGNICIYFAEGSINLYIILAGIIVTIYSAFGGIRAVTYTDMLQFVIFGFAIPIIGILIWNNAYELGVDVSSTFQQDKFNITKILDFGNPDFLSLIALFLFFFNPSIDPALCQRIMMGRDIRQVKKAFLITAILIFLIRAALAWIPFLLYSINPNIDPSNLLSYIIDNYTYTGFKGLVIIGIISMAMSTADSNINSSSVLFANDLCKPLGIGLSNQLFVAKLFSFILGLAAIALALVETDLLSMILFTSSFYMPTVSVTFMMAVAGFRTSTKAAMIGIIAGFATTVVWHILEIEMDGIFIAMLVNVLFLMGSHYILKQPGGWVGPKNGKNVEFMDQEKLDKKKQHAQQPKSFSLLDYFKKKAPKDELSYIGWGAYCIVFTITTMYSTQSALLTQNRQIILFLYQLMMVTGVVLSTYPIWPASIPKKIRTNIAEFAWPLTVFYVLILCNTFFMLISNFSLLQFAVFSINLVICSILVGWALAGMMMVVGVIAAISFFNYFFSEYSLDFNIGSPGFISAYVVTLVATVLVIFIKPKEEYLEATEAKVDCLEAEITELDHEVVGLNHTVTNLNDKVVHYSEKIVEKDIEIERLGATAQRILNNVNHELRLPVGNVMNFAEMLHEGLEKHSPKELKELSDEVYKNSTRLSTMILNMLDLATLRVKNVNLEKTMVNLSELVKDRVKICRNIYLQGKPINFKLIIDPEVLISVDPNYMRQVVDNLVINAINFSTEGLIEVTLQKQKYSVIFTITDQGIGIPANDIYDVFTPFKMGSNTESKAQGRGVGLALCKSVVEAHDGSISAESKAIGATLRFMLPF